MEKLTLRDVIDEMESEIKDFNGKWDKKRFTNPELAYSYYDRAEVLEKYLPKLKSLSAPTSSLKWVRASERLPIIQTQVILEHIESGIIYLGNFDKNEEGCWLYIQSSDAYKGWAIADEGDNFSHWQWLKKDANDAIKKQSEQAPTSEPDGEYDEFDKFQKWFDGLNKNNIQADIIWNHFQRYYIMPLESTPVQDEPKDDKQDVTTVHQ